MFCPETLPGLLSIIAGRFGVSPWQEISTRSRVHAVSHRVNSLSCDECHWERRQQAPSMHTPRRSMSETSLVSFLPVSDSQARLTLGAMKAVAAAGGELRPADRSALEGAARHVLYGGEDLDFTTIESPSPDALAQALPTET